MKELDRKRAHQTKATDAGLEGFVDWSGVLSSESAEEDEMSMLATGFAARMQKRIADLEDESAPTFEGKRPRHSSLNEEALKDWVIIPVDSPDRATNDQLVSEGAPSGVGASLEEGIPARGPTVNEIGEGSPLGVAAAPLPPPKPANTVPSRKRPPDQLLMSMYVPPYERIYPRWAWLPLI